MPRERIEPVPVPVVADSRIAKVFDGAARVAELAREIPYISEYASFVGSNALELATKSVTALRRSRDTMSNELNGLTGQYNYPQRPQQ